MEAMEDFWARSSEILRAHKEELWTLSSESIRVHREGLRKSGENLKIKSSELIASITGTLNIEQRLAEGLKFNISELLFERQRVLADRLKNSLTSKLKIFIIFFLIFGFQRYVNSELTDISLLFFVISVAAYYIHRVSSAAAPPVLFYKQGDWMESLLEQCPSLFKPYKPTLLWGWNGHLQTGVLGKMGRSVNPVLPQVRRCFKVEDGATVYYDTFDPPFTRAVATVIVVPGINNTSEKLYIKTFVRSCLGASYRVVVLNHLGSLKDYPITSPRIFGYGHTGELARLVDIVQERYKTSPKLLVGFSMGGNIAAKYLVEEPDRQDIFVGVVTSCQGYDIMQTSSYLLCWGRLARLYNWAMTNDALKATINRHGKVMYDIYDQRKVALATCIQDFDACVMSKKYKFESVDDMYSAWSCARDLDKMKIPMMTLNAVDDPIIAPYTNDIAIRLACQNDKILHVQTQCGGHLGFYSGGWVIPDGLSWMDTTIVEYLTAILSISKHQDEEAESSCSTIDSYCSNVDSYSDSSSSE